MESRLRVRRAFGVVGVEVPAADLLAINGVATSCPSLTAPRLAAEIMAGNGFGTPSTAGATASAVGLGVLSAQQWDQRKPSDNAKLVLRGR